MSESKYTHPLPLNMPIFFILLGSIHIPTSLFVVRILYHPTLWSHVTTEVNFSELFLIYHFAAIGVDSMFIVLGVWLLLNKEKSKPKDDGWTGNQRVEHQQP